jgi:predicted nucleotidyltransferase
MVATTSFPSQPNNDDVEVLEEIRRIVRDGLRGTDARVFLFGSRAGGRPHRASDVDVAVLPQTPLPAGLLSRIKEALDESTVPFSVDLVNLDDVDAVFRERVLRQGVPWTD